MRMRLAIVGTAIALAGALPAGADEAGRLTLEDLLQAEGLGEAWFSPDGARIAFNRSLPATERAGGGFISPELAGGRVFVAAKDGEAPTELVGKPGAGYRLMYTNPWAPDGRGLLLIEVHEGVFRFAFWDARSGTIRTLPGRPYTTMLAAAEWVGERIAYAVLAPESSQRGSHAQMLDRLERKWRSAWGGNEPQVTVSSANDIFRTSEPPPGALMMIEPAGGKASKAAVGDYIAVYPSPDGRRFAAIRLAEGIPQPLFPAGRRSELQLFEVTDEGVILVERFGKLDVGFGSASWSASGEDFLFGAKRVGEGQASARLFLYRQGDSLREIALPEGSSIIDPDVGSGGALLSVGWIGKTPAAVVNAAGDGRKGEPAPATGTRLDYGETEDLRFDVHAFPAGKARNLTGFAESSVNDFLAPSGESFALVVADGALWRVAPDEAPERVSPADAPLVLGFAVAGVYPPPPTESAYHGAADEERVALLTMEEDGPARRVLDLADATFGPATDARQVAAISPDLAATVSRATDGWAQRLVLNDGGATTLAEVNAALNGRDVAAVERFGYTVGERELNGWVVLPPGAEAGVPLPAVVSIYGGAVYGAHSPPAAAMPGYPYAVFSGQLLASQGYAVIYPSTPLDSGAETDVMAALAEHAVAAVDALAAKGTVDPQRVGVTGQSFGGFSTAAILAKRPDRFRAGVAMAGIYDWIHGYGIKSLAQTLTDDGRDEVLELRMIEEGQIRLRDPFWEDPAPYVRNSPIFHVDDIDSPLLLLHGDLDMGVTGITGAERMYNALVRAGKKPTLVRYWGEGHVAGAAWAIRDQWSRITTWFDSWLR